jgi:hypothetical protein
MSEVKVNKISPRTNCGTVQLGDSGDTITIPAGATITNSGTQTGFGRTGAVDWQTTVKTSTFTAVSGEGYFVDTNGGAVTANLPAGTAGAIVAFKDYRNTFDSNALTIAQNGSDKIGGSTVNATISTEGIGITLVFIDSTRGWLVTNDGLQSQASTAQYVAATGGTVTTVCTNFKVHTFTSPGTFCVSSAGNACGSNTVDYLIVAGAGGGGMGGNAASLPSPDKTDGGGGGGAGGYRESSGAASGCYTRSPLGACVAALPVAASPYPVTVGGGGAGSPGNCNPGTNGSNSVFAGSSTITSTGGGGGGSKNNPGGAASGPFSGNTGGSGGGATHRNSPTANSTTGGGAGNTPPVSPPQGNGGGNANNPWANARGGGGGGAQGSGAPGCNSGDGGAGFTSCITASPVGYAGGGGAAGGPAGGPAPAAMANGGEGGVLQSPGTDRVSNTFGAGDGAGGSETKTAGTDNRGSGGGGSNPASPGGANGGSGVVIIRYKFQN